MRLDRIDLNLFVLFDALYEERSVTRAASRLSLTQPAVSNALSRLRKTFDDPLFVRTPEGMAPTTVADSVVGDVREALQLLGRSVGANARFEPQASKKVFRVGMNDLAESLLLSRIYSAIKREGQEISIGSYYANREEATEELKANKIDLLLDSSEVNAKQLCLQPLAKLPYVCAVHRKHKLAKKKLTMANYLAAEHLHVSSRRRGRGQVDIALHKQGNNRRISMRVQNYLMAARIAKETDLLWTVPLQLAQALPLTLLELPFPVEPLEWNLYWQQGADSDPANQWLRNIFTAAIDETLNS